MIITREVIRRGANHTVETGCFKRQRVGTQKIVEFGRLDGGWKEWRQREYPLAALVAQSLPREGRHGDFDEFAQ